AVPDRRSLPVRREWVGRRAAGELESIRPHASGPSIQRQGELRICIGKSSWRNTSCYYDFSKWFHLKPPQALLLIQVRHFADILEYLGIGIAQAGPEDSVFAGRVRRRDQAEISVE